MNISYNVPMKNKNNNTESCLWGNTQIMSQWFHLKRYYTLNMSVYEMEPHEHKEIEIMYAAYGECEITYFDQEGIQHNRMLKKEEYVVLDAGVRHSLYVKRGGNCKILNLELALKAAETDLRIQNLCDSSGSFSRLLRENVTYLFLQDKNNEIYSLIQRLQEYDKSDTDQAERGISRDLYLQQMLLTIARQSGRIRQPSRGNFYVRRIREYLENNYENDIRIGILGEELGVSEAHLQRLYKQAEGESIITALNRIRMEKACVLLLHSKLPVIDVAVSVGFHNRQHFSHVFNKVKGCSPAEYRKLKGNGEVFEGFY